MVRLFDRLDRALRAVCIVLVLAMLALLAAQIAARYLWGKSLSWSEELSLLGFAWTIAIATALGVRHGLHARVSALPDALPPGARRLLERGIGMLLALLGAALMVSGWHYVQETRGMLSAAAQYPLEMLHAVAPVFGLLLALFGLERACTGGGPA